MEFLINFPHFKASDLNELKWLSTWLSSIDDHPWECLLSSMATMATTVASRDTRLSEVMQFLPAPAETNSDNSETTTADIASLYSTRNYQEKQTRQI